MPDTVTPVTLSPFDSRHVSAAVALSAAESWPHRAEDWQQILDLSEGRAAEEEGELVGTGFCTRYGGELACLNMIIVGEAMRGRGLGRRLMQEIMGMTGTRGMQLVATQSGLPLYRKLGFEETGQVVQHQGIARGVAASDGIDQAGPDDIGALIALDRHAFGADRSALVRRLAAVADVAVLRGGDGIEGVAYCREFGRGRVIGPVVACGAEEAQRLIAAHIVRNTGSFVRIDCGEETGLAPWLESCGLAHAGGGVLMHHGARPKRPASGPRIFALASQALG